ncbi:GPR1/FUN34/YaaH family transporter [Haladaptatus caseinilyticus]|uniref:GPR1/FUN34/YaaH family transporter n=1 Tax=Haladaptatus caseinilyticus TaxID=2993314 RepID=UPI00224B0776|nr:GPR1/FUN34/YaaH family transporter [Haladaptatus caseinilyticus]
MTQSKSVNPGIFPLLLFGYSLAVLGAELLIAHEAAGALVFAIFIAAIGESIGGLWEISQGKTYLGSVVTTFGIWLFGLFMLETVGQVLGLVTSQALATYFLVLLVPIILLGYPAFKNQLGWQIQGAFVFLFLLVLFAGVNFIITSSVLNLAAGTSAWLAAICIWLLAAEDIFAIDIGSDIETTSAEIGETQHLE